MFPKRGTLYKILLSDKDEVSDNNQARYKWRSTHFQGLKVMNFSEQESGRTYSLQVCELWNSLNSSFYLKVTA